MKQAQTYRGLVLLVRKAAEHGLMFGFALCAGYAPSGPASAASGMPPAAAYREPLDAAAIEEVKGLFKKLIDAENAHDTEAVRPYVWDTPSTLFVAKTVTPAAGNWAGFWGKEVVLDHFHDLYQGTFHIEPDYSKEKLVGLTADVAELYVPVSISVSYAGQAPVPKPFIIVMDWIRTQDGWKMATDIALPVPPAPSQSN